MRTTVYTDPNDPDETDEFPECHASVTDEGALWIVSAADSSVEAEYVPGEWVSAEIIKG